ncbi:MAG: hypothetical protein RID23_13205 [Roseovarius sp.]
MSDDITFKKNSAYGSVSWVAERLGLSKSRFIKKKKTFEAEGFPTPDHLTGVYHKADVDAWIDNRRRIPDANVVMFPGPKERTEVKLDAL